MQIKHLILIRMNDRLHMNVLCAYFAKLMTKKLKYIYIEDNDLHSYDTLDVIPFISLINFFE